MSPKGLFKDLKNLTELDLDSTSIRITEKTFQGLNKGVSDLNNLTY